MLSLKFQWWTGLTFIIPKAHTHTFSIAVINDEFPYFRRLAVRKPTWLTSKLTEPLWSVSNALNRKCAYVEASTERTNTHVVSWLQLNQQQQEKMLQKGNFVAFLQRIKKRSTMFFFKSFMIKEKKICLELRVLFVSCVVSHYIYCSASLLSEQIYQSLLMFSLLFLEWNLCIMMRQWAIPPLSHTHSLTHIFFEGSLT